MVYVYVVSVVYMLQAANPPSPPHGVGTPLPLCGDGCGGGVW